MRILSYKQIGLIIGAILIAIFLFLVLVNDTSTKYGFYDYMQRRDDRLLNKKDSPIKFKFRKAQRIEEEAAYLKGQGKEYEARQKYQEALDLYTEVYSGYKYPDVHYGYMQDEAVESIKNLQSYLAGKKQPHGERRFEW